MVSFIFPYLHVRIIRSYFLPYAPLLLMPLFFSTAKKELLTVALLPKEKHTRPLHKEFHCGQG
jgi:hypothetical protein